MANKGLVLVTGVNGYIAARTVEAFLNAGHRVRGTVRSKSSAAGLLQVLAEHVRAGNLEIIEVPDITKDGAFDEAVKDVDAIAHLAAPVSFQFTDPEPVMHAAVQGTRSIMESAVKVSGGNLKTVVYMSSIAAILSQRQPPYTYTESDWNDYAEAEVARLGKDTPGRLIYGASKTAAEKAFWEFRDRLPSVTMSAVNPVFVMGPPLVPPKSPSDIKETTISVYTILSGQDLPPPMGPHSTSIDVRDVARLVTWAVDYPTEANNERYIACSAVGGSQAIADILNKAYPKKHLKVGEPGKGYLPDYSFPEGGMSIDSSKAVKATGQAWISFEQTVLDTAKMFEAIASLPGMATA